MAHESVSRICQPWKRFPSTVPEMAANSGSSWLCRVAFQHVYCCLSLEAQGSTSVQLMAWLPGFAINVSGLHLGAGCKQWKLLVVKVAFQHAYCCLQLYQFRLSLVLQQSSWLSFQDLPAMGAVSIQELGTKSGSSWLCTVVWHFNMFTVACQIRYSVVVKHGSWLGFQGMQAMGTVSIQDLAANSGSSLLCSIAFQHVYCCLSVQANCGISLYCCLFTYQVSQAHCSIFQQKNALNFAACWVPSDLGDFFEALSFLGHETIFLRA